LRSFLCDWLVFDKLYTQQHEDDLFKYWNALEEASNSGMIQYNLKKKIFFF